jgi:hypothetical protein
MPLRAEECSQKWLLPVILTEFKFDTAPVEFTTKLPKQKRNALQTVLSEKIIAEGMSGVDSLKFLQWSATRGSEGAVLTAYLKGSKGPIGYNIDLCYRASIPSISGVEPLEFPCEASPVFSATSSYNPGAGGNGELWEQRITRQLENRIKSADFQEWLVEYLRQLPLSQSEDIIFSESDKRIGLPLCEKRLHAKAGSKLEIRFERKGNENTALIPLQTMETRIGKGDWKERVQGDLWVSPGYELTPGFPYKKWGDAPFLFAQRKPNSVKVLFQEYIFIYARTKGNRVKDSK